MCSSLDPDCCKSTVVRGSGFLQLTIHLVSTRSFYTPFGRGLRIDTDHSRHGRLDALLVQCYSSLHIEQVIPPPLEFDRFRLVWVILVFLLYSDIDVPERLWNEALNFVPLIDDEPQCGELAGTCEVRCRSRDARVN